MMVRERATRSVKAASTMPITVVLAVLVGVAIAPGGGFDWLYALYDDVRPVVTMSGTLVSRDADSALIDIAGEKHRSCQFLSIRAYSMRDGTLMDANIERVDRPQDGHTKPVGRYDIGRWRVWPVKHAVGVKVYVKHSCDGRLVLTKISEVAL